MSRHLLYYILINALIAILLVWHSYTRYDDFKNHHIALANESVNSLSLEISNFIKERQRLVALFAKQHEKLISQIIEQTDNDNLKTSMREQLREFFPQSFTFTVANNNGIPYLADFDGHVGELCVTDIARFSHSGKNQPQIHPGIDAYHFDIMSNIKTIHSDTIFFVSFHADILGSTIKAIEIPGHTLQLVFSNERLLLEVNNKGARNNTLRDDYRLTSKETGMILASTKVDNSRWHAIDLHHPNLFSSYLKKTLIESSIFLLFSMVITAFFYYRIKNEEMLRTIAENSKNDFLSIISHELRTPLTSIHGAITLLADNRLEMSNDKSKQMLDIAKKNTSHLLHLINEILDFRKIESNSMEYNFQECELNEVIQEAVNGMNDYANQYNASIIFSRHEKPVYANIDKLRIIQVANNLISNAIKYGAPNDTIKVEMTVSDNIARISIHDNGAGVPTDFVDKIFDKFAQANIQNKSKGSTGLGLNIARTFIEAHHGRINFTTSSQGSTFYFELPVNK